MALADSGRAIGAVTRLVRDHLLRRGFAVAVGKPEVAANNDALAKLNLFLYQTDVDASLRNRALREGDDPPIWLQLRYILTAFDEGEESDSADAHDLLGRGLSALHELNFLRLDDAVTPEVRLALENNPEPLKVTLEETPADLLSKLMGGADERYRLSAAFEVRPVMIVPGEPDHFPQLVGVDYSTAPETVIGEDGIGLVAIPSLGPRLERVEPDTCAPGATLTVYGDDLHLSGLDATLGGVPVGITSQRPDRATVRVEGTFSDPATEGPLAAGGALSAGEHPLRFRQALPSGRRRGSNPLLVRLLPVVDDADLAGDGTLTVQGRLLGTWDDDVVVALIGPSGVAHLLQMGLEPPPAPAAGTVAPGADQKSLTVAAAGAGVAPGNYRVVVRVNGQEARRRPSVTVP